MPWPCPALSVWVAYKYHITSPFATAFISNGLYHIGCNRDRIVTVYLNWYVQKSCLVQATKFLLVLCSICSKEAVSEGLKSYLACKEKSTLWQRLKLWNLIYLTKNPIRWIYTWLSEIRLSNIKNRTWGLLMGPEALKLFNAVRNFFRVTFPWFLRILVIKTMQTRVWSI